MQNWLQYYCYVLSALQLEGMLAMIDGTLLLTCCFGAQGPADIPFRPADEDAKNFREHWSVQFWRDFPAKRDAIMKDNSSDTSGYENLHLWLRPALGGRMLGFAITLQ